MFSKNKVRCSNCGTTIKNGEKSCPICHMLVEKPKEKELTEEEKEEKEFEEYEESTVKKQFPMGKIIMIGIIVVGMILTIKGIVEYQNVEYCTADDCGFKSLFMAGFGIILIISASVSLVRNETKS